MPVLGEMSRPKTKAWQAWRCAFFWPRCDCRARFFLLARLKVFWAWTPKVVWQVWSRTKTQVPASAWQRVTLPALSRAFRTPKVLDGRARLRDYEGELRQVTVIDLGHEEPTVLLSNDFRATIDSQGYPGNWLIRAAGSDSFVLTPTPTAEMSINGKPGVIEKVDDLTARFKFPDPYPGFMDVILGATYIGLSQSNGGGTALRIRQVARTPAPTRDAAPPPTALTSAPPDHAPGASRPAPPPETRA